MYEDISPGVGSLRTPKETVFVLLFFKEFQLCC